MSSVLIVDDHPMIQLAVRSILEREGYEVLGAADNGIEALAKLKELTPDLVILDIRIPRLQGLEVMRRIVGSGLNTKVLVLSSLPAAVLARRCMTAGASAFLCKKSGLQDLLHGVKSVLDGYSYFPVYDESIEEEAFASRVYDDQMLESLTDQEVMVLQYLVAGCPATEIAEQMLLSTKTVSTYKCRIQAKLRIKSLMQLQDFAKRNSLI
ncbi:putative two-component response regulator [Pseudomonas sp. ATCC 13867]|uniref:response regulator transcription factor n=1 Tax=Pseudomonas sp. ATCC 13867 TaxID=1294143 RepID=UPI0002C4DE67|nr:response regulator transcription factor [Pseudomonas sp. ATCC 13867]AGI24582.1 putative two-component response regulator [Pseudomonas sp. ATCC 13867]RFQ18407.1 DNA-binding response regulator [Pseudomonas sp. ATCC 13867]